MDAGTTDRNEVLFESRIRQSPMFRLASQTRKVRPAVDGRQRELSAMVRARPVFDTGARANDGCRDPCHSVEEMLLKP